MISVAIDCRTFRKPINLQNCTVVKTKHYNATELYTLLGCVIKMDEKTAKAAFLLFDDYLDVCLNLDERDEFNCIREDKKAIKKALYKDEITEDEYRQKDSEIFWKYVQMVSVT